MFDNGFESKEAVANVENAVEKLGVDFMFYKSNYMKKMFSKILETNSKAVVCHPCSLWYMDLAYEIADRHEIPIIIAGWTKGQSTSQKIMSKCGCNASTLEFKEMGEATKDFIEKYVKDDPLYKDFPNSMEDVMRVPPPDAYQGANVSAMTRYDARVVSGLPPDWPQYVQR